MNQLLILFPFLEPVAGTAEELATEIRPQDATDTKQAVHVCEGESAFECLHHKEFVHVI